MNKKELKTNLKQKIDEVFDRVEKLEQKKDHLNDQLKNSYKTQIADLNRRKKDLQKRYEDVQNATDENWKEVKEAFSKSLKHYEAGFAEIGKLFK